MLLAHLHLNLISLGAQSLLEAPHHEVISFLYVFGDIQILPHFPPVTRVLSDEDNLILGRPKHRHPTFWGCWHWTFLLEEDLPFVIDQIPSILNHFLPFELVPDCI